MMEDETGEESGYEPGEDGGCPTDWQVVYPTQAAHAGWWAAIEECAVGAMTVWSQQGVRVLTHQFEKDGVERVWRTEFVPGDSLRVSAQAAGPGTEFVLEWVLEGDALRPFWFQAVYGLGLGDGCCGRPAEVVGAEAA